MIAGNVEPNDILIQDNSGIHTAPICVQAMTNHNISVIQLPAYSPDMSIIGELYAYMLNMLNNFC